MIFHVFLQSQKAYTYKSKSYKIIYFFLIII